MSMVKLADEWADELDADTLRKALSVAFRLHDAALVDALSERLIAMDRARWSEGRRLAVWAETPGPWRPTPAA